MADNKQNKRPNVPPLRFPEFAGEWERTKLGNHITIYSGSSPNLIVEENGEIPYYKVEQLNWCDKYLSDTPYLSKRNKLTLPPNCIVFSKRGAAILTNKVRINPFAINIDTNLMGISVNDSSSLDCNFLYYFILKAELGKIADTSTIPQINNIHINPLIIPIPSIGEQRKVAKFISLLDHRIAVQSKLIEQLESLIKGITLQASKSSDCESVLLSDILTERNEVNTAQHEVCSVSVSQGVVNQVEYLGRSFAAKDISHYNVVHYGDIIYTKSPTGDFPYGIVKRSHQKNLVAVSPLYGVYIPASNDIGCFLHYYFCNAVSAKNYLHKLIQKGAKNTINITNQRFLENTINLPKAEKLAQVVTLLNCLTAKKQQAENLLILLNKQKQFFLNQMFI